jgi:two-component system, LytTR family, sensor kinase
MAVSSHKIVKIAWSYCWSILIWLGFSPVLAGQDKVRLLERGLYTDYWVLLLVNGAWLLAAALLTPPIFSIVRRYPIAKARDVRRIAGYVLGSIPYVIASACVRWIVLPPWNSAAQRFGHRSLQGLIHSTYIFGDLTRDYILIVVAAHAYWYFTRARDQELEHAELQQALAASELQALKSQLHPHFLFNTLHGISALIDTDGARAKAMVLKISRLLRTALQYGSADLVCLDDELKFVEDYLDLEKTRLEERLDVRWEIGPDTRQILVPQLILQPLVENAILHGVACCRSGGWIEILTRRTNRSLEIHIRNSAGGKRQEGTGVGLENTKARLKCLYSDEAGLFFDIGRDGVVVATLVIPAIGAQRLTVDAAPAPMSHGRQMGA